MPFPFFQQLRCHVLAFLHVKPLAAIFDLALLFLRAQQYFAIFSADTSGGDDLKVDGLGCYDIVAFDELQWEPVWIRAEFCGKSDPSRFFDSRAFIGIGFTRIGAQALCFTYRGNATGVWFRIRLSPAFCKAGWNNRRIKSKHENHTN